MPAEPNEVKKCEICRWVFDWPRSGDVYLIRGEEHAICNGCADRISETRRFTIEFESTARRLAASRPK